jgi:hypothetical protein
MAKKPAAPSRAEIKPRVINNALVPEAKRNSASPGKLARLVAGDEDLVLSSDLNINETRRMVLSKDNTRIRTFNFYRCSESDWTSDRSDIISRSPYRLSKNWLESRMFHSMNRPLRTVRLRANTYA